MFYIAGMFSGEGYYMLRITFHEKRIVETDTHVKDGKGIYFESLTIIFYSVSFLFSFLD